MNGNEFPSGAVPSGRGPTRGAPPPALLAAFGGHEQARRLAGGQGDTWRSGQLVLKPCAAPAEAAWIADALSTLPAKAEIRVPRPVRTTSGAWLAAGWQAREFLDGETDPNRWDEALAAGRAFHSLVAGLPRPGFLDDRDDPWTFGERLAWDELPFDGVETMAELLEPLAAARRPIDLVAQPVHGDLLGNVLFADGQPPAVIDWSVYYRPPAWASAVVVVDALTWQHAPASLLEGCADGPAWDQLLVRALLYRIATNEGFRRRGRPVHESVQDYRAVTDLVLVRASAG